MTKHFRLLFIVISLILATVFITGCDSDNEDNSKRQTNILADVTFFSSLPYTSETLGYWSEDSFIRFYPKATPPFSLLVITRNNEGKAALKKIADAEETAIEQIYQLNDSVYLVSSSLYFESPLFYVSNSYRTNEMEKDSYPILILPKIIVKMKSGGDVSTIKEKYKNKLTYNPDSQTLLQLGVTIFDSNLGNSNDLLKLIEEIGQNENVAWAESDNLGGYYSFF